MTSTLAMSEARDWASEALRPPPPLTPSEFARKHRVMHSVYCSEHPGPWDDTIFPHQNHIMDMYKEAIDTGKRGVVTMKCGQGGGTDGAINGMLWLKVYFPGPQLFITSIEKTADNMGRERFENIIRDCPPLARMRIPGRTTNTVKRFVDGRIQLCGGQSVFKLQSDPYRVVAYDEIDSLVENLGNEGDPIELGVIRTDAFRGPTLMIAYAHPTTKDRGAGKLFYELSDQRRPHIIHACGGEHYISFDHMRPVKDGNAADPADYAYHCPHCDQAISDAEREAMARKMVYKSALAPEVAAKKTWIGNQFSQLLTPGKTIRGFATRLLACGEDENKLKVFYNKVAGETREPKVSKIDDTTLRKLAVVKRRANDPEFYSRGQVPPGVRFLTAGQDSRSTQFHYTIWGWGLRRSTAKTMSLCAWLIDWGEIERKYSLSFQESEYHVFDDLIYNRAFPSTVSDRLYHVVMCGHDIGYDPTQIPIISYCRTKTGRAIPMRGASIDATSASRAAFARWGAGIRLKPGQGDEVIDQTSKALIVNTYMLKTEFYGWIPLEIEVPEMIDGHHVGLRTVPIITLPEDVDNLWIAQTSNEFLGKGKKKNEKVWQHSGPNHLADCNTYAHACALQLDPFQDNLTAPEAQALEDRPAPVQQVAHSQYQTPDGRPYLITER